MLTTEGYLIPLCLQEFRALKSNNDRLESSRQPSGLRRRQSSMLGFSENQRNTVCREDFVENYPKFLWTVTESTPSKALSTHDIGNMSESPGVDICFQDLCLAVSVGDKTVNVVDHVSGRVRAKTMTALMGGSGAGEFGRLFLDGHLLFRCLRRLIVEKNTYTGKTSLLNALCGRAFYGTALGKIHLNGQEASIEEIKDSVGFVPQV